MKLEKVIPKKSTVILAFSGGPDSVYLMNFLIKLQKKHPFKIVLAHFNHKLRGRASNKDEKFSKKTAKKNNIKFETTSYDIKQYAKKHKLSLEEAARKKRYEFLEKTRLKYDAKYILTAHHLDDNLETFLINFTRGSGIKGLKGMDFKSGFLLRPLLEIEKDEILSFLKENKIKYKTDKSNKNTKFTRNKIRINLIPQIKKIQPNINNIFKRTRRQLKEIDDFMDKSTTEWIKQNKINKKNKLSVLKSYEFPINKFSNLHEALKSRIIHKLYSQFHENIDGVNNVLIKKVLALIQTGKTGKTVPFGRKTVLTRTSKTFLCMYNNTKTEIKFKKINIPGKTQFEYGEIKTSIKDFKSINKWQTINLDYSKLNLPLYVRSKKAGDKVKLLGMSGVKKVKDIFIDKKIPSFERKSIPIFVDAKNNIIAIGKNLISNDKKVTKTTKKILCIKIRYL